MKTEYKYVRFERIKSIGKTKIWLCYNKIEVILGVVKWFGRWRQYCFFAANEIILNTGCMNDICDFIKSAMEEWRRGKKKG